MAASQDVPNTLELTVTTYNRPLATQPPLIPTEVVFWTYCELDIVPKRS